MTQSIIFKSAILAAVSVSGTAALADLTPQDVWAEWKTQLENYSYTVTATETSSGNDLTISDFSMRSDFPDNEGSAEISGYDITFIDNGDGTVSVVLPTIDTLSAAIDMADEGKFSFDMPYTTSGFNMVVSGAPGDITFTYSAAGFEFSIENLVIDDEALPIGQAKFDMANLAGIAQLISGDLNSQDRSFSADTLNYLIDITDPEGGEDRGFFKGQLTGLATKFKGDTPTDFDWTEASDFYTSGLTAVMEVLHNGSDGEFSIVADGDAISGTTTASGGLFGFDIDTNRVTFEASATDGETTITTSQFPVPLTTGYAKSEIGMEIPIAPSAEPADFALLLNLEGLAVSDVIWGMFDPTAQLPRDPADLTIDLNGKARMDESVLEGNTSDDAFELHGLEINEILLDVAGAKLTGDGAFTFDNTDLETFDGLPRPEGVANFKLVGANGLLDTLVSMGILGSEDAMGARMMMGMFAKPAGEDTLTSTIEINEAGNVAANGMRLR